MTHIIFEPQWCHTMVKFWKTSSVGFTCADFSLRTMGAIESFKIISSCVGDKLSHYWMPKDRGWRLLKWSILSPTSQNCRQQNSRTWEDDPREPNRWRTVYFSRFHILLTFYTSIFIIHMTWCLKYDAFPWILSLWLLNFCSPETGNQEDKTGPGTESSEDWTVRDGVIPYPGLRVLGPLSQG